MRVLIDSSFLERYEWSVTKTRLAAARDGIADHITRAPKERPVASPLKVEFQFDFGSPNAYLAELALPAIERRTGVKFEYVPVLLGGIYKATDNMSPGESLRGIKNKPEYQALETQRFLRRHNITKFRQNPFFPGQHADADARRRRGAVRGHVRTLFPRRLPSHVGRAEEDGRCRSVSAVRSLHRASTSNG